MSELPPRPSLESIRKQAKKLRRERSMPLREAQLVIAREYGFPGWPDLVAEVMRRTDRGLDSAGGEAMRVIHDNDTGRLKELLAEHPTLVSWRDAAGRTLLLEASEPYGDAGDDFRERMFTRFECAEMLIDAGARVDTPVLDGVVRGRARQLLRLLERKNAVPRTLEYLAALGDIDAIRRLFDEGAPSHGHPGLPSAFDNARRWGHKEIAAWLLDRMIELDAALGVRIDAGPGRQVFIDFLAEHTEDYGSPWQTFVTLKILEPVKRGDRAEFERLLELDPQLVGPDAIDVQVRIIEVAILDGHKELNKRKAIIEALFAHDPAILRASPPPPSKAIEFAFEYAKVSYLPLITRIWPVPDDLPHAAGMGHRDRVKRWFEGGRRPARKVIDLALAWSVMNNQFETADYLLAHGADINTRWSSHEPASILHELVWYENYEAMQFLIDRGIDMTIHDYRWDATAEGWARYAAKNDKLADFLADAARRRSP